MSLGPFRRRCHRPSEEAQDALAQGKRARLDAERLHKHVVEVAAHTAEIRRQNNFAAAVASAFRGG